MILPKEKIPGILQGLKQVPLSDIKANDTFWSLVVDAEDNSEIDIEKQVATEDAYLYNDLWRVHVMTEAGEVCEFNASFVDPNLYSFYFRDHEPRRPS